MSALVPFRGSLLDDLFDRGWTSNAIQSRFNPALDVSEAEDQYTIRLDVPGVKKGDLTVEVRDNVLTIRGHREWRNDGEADGMNHLERGYGTFERMVTLPRGAGEPQAELADGVLTLTISKPVEARPKRIEIAGGDREPETIEA